MYLGNMSRFLRGGRCGWRPKATKLRTEFWWACVNVLNVMHNVTRCSCLGVHPMSTVCLHIKGTNKDWLQHPLPRLAGHRQQEVIPGQSLKACVYQYFMADNLKSCLQLTLSTSEKSYTFHTQEELNQTADSLITAIVTAINDLFPGIPIE